MSVMLTTVGLAQDRELRAVPCRARNSRMRFAFCCGLAPAWRPESPSMRASPFNENGWLDRSVDLHGWSRAARIRSPNVLRAAGLSSSSCVQLTGYSVTSPATYCRQHC